MSGTELLTAQMRDELAAAYCLRVLCGEALPLPDRLQAPAEMLCVGLGELAERYPSRAKIEEQGTALRAHEDLRDLLTKVIGGKLDTLDGAALLMALMAPHWATRTGTHDRATTADAHLFYVGAAEYSVMLKCCMVSVSVGFGEFDIRRQENVTTDKAQIKRLARELLGVEA